VAEELASGRLTDLGTFDIAGQDAAEYFHLYAYLELRSLVDPSLARGDVVCQSS
jgi:hypothetical protein